MDKNIVLIGMSGSGKTTIGAFLSNSLKMTFADTDEIIEKEQQRKIKDIFSDEGEEYFRNLETECAKKVSTLKNMVISTGGGMILREENMEFLKRNSVCIYLKRSVESITKTMDTANRPLLKDGISKLYDMEKTRTPLYEKYADFICESEETPEKTVEKILNYLKNNI